MKIEILGRHIEIDDAEVMKVFEDKYNRYEYLEMDKDQFIQRGLDYFEHALKRNILYALDTNLGIAIRTFKSIAGYKYEETVSPFVRPGCDMKYIQQDGLYKDDEIFYRKYYMDDSEKNDSERNDNINDNKV